MKGDIRTAAQLAKLRTLIRMMNHVMPDLVRLDKVSAYLLSMLLLALKEKLEELEKKKL